MTGTTIRVVVVDDSPYSRRSITRMLEALEGVEVVGYAVNGEEGIQKVIALKPDLVTLDLEMPRMDGFTLLRILTVRFSLPVLVISALCSADKVFRALELGALDFVAKPSGEASEELLSIRDELHRRVQQIMTHRPNLSRKRSAAGSAAELNPVIPLSGNGQTGIQAVDLVAIGASTGGPPALQQIFSRFERQFPFAVVVAQHMPVGFTRAFAERLNRLFPFDIKEAEDGDLILPGRVLIAPGGKNMQVVMLPDRAAVSITEPTTADRYVPSVDVMLHSCAEAFRSRVAAVILTGMGNDGSKGVRSVKDRGGVVIAESEESAVVYGMPREAVATGLVDRCVPLDAIADEILSLGTVSRTARSAHIFAR